MVHGYDFASTGDEDAKWLGREVVKTHIVGAKPHMSQEATVSNRVSRSTERGWDHEADPGHAELPIKFLKLEQAKPASTAGEDEKDWEPEEEADKLEGQPATEYRASAAHADYLAAAGPDMHPAPAPPCAHWPLYVFDLFKLVGPRTRGRTARTIAMVGPSTASSWSNCRCVSSATSSSALISTRFVLSFSALTSSPVGSGDVSPAPSASFNSSALS